MKKILISMLGLMTGLHAIAASTWINVSSAVPAEARIELLSSSNEKSVVRLRIGGFFLQAVNAEKTASYTVNVPGGTPLLEKGSPDLPKFTASLVIPDLGGMEVEVISSQYTDYHYNIAPSKGNLTRDIDPSTLPYVYGEAYQLDAFYPGELAYMQEPYIMRDLRGQTIVICPFRYNPVTQTLRVYHDIRVALNKTVETGANPFLSSRADRKITREFHEIYKRHFLNYPSSKYTPVDEEGEMLIISHGPFMTTMQPFVEWKISKGIPVTMVDVSTIGNSAAIKTYIETFYNEHDLAFVILVGDHQQVPTYFSTSGAGDNTYGYTAGSDHYADVLVGRFSAENEEHVATHVNKVLYYEKTPDVSVNWFRSSVGIASEQGPGDDNEMDYEHIRNLQTQLDGYTYETFYELFDGSQGGLDASGDPTPSQVTDAINAGASIITYCGHGSQTSWGSSGFDNSDVNALSNSGKLPFIWSVACVNGDFTNATCFAEAWMRAKQSDQLTGSIATLMSTINQSWNPPMEGEDEMVSILTESYAGNIKRTFGGLSMNGCAQMNDAYGNGGYTMADTWNLFGDPSVVVRTDLPQAITATHDPTVFLGMDQFQLTCPFDGTLACISLNNQILGTSLIAGGSATINFPGPLTMIDTLTLVISGYNLIPYIVNIPVIAASGPFMAYQTCLVNDSQGNNNNQPDFGENVTLDVTLKNLGVAQADGVTATLATIDPYITITDNTQAYGNIPASNISTQTGAFALTIADDVPDQHAVSFSLTITDNNGGNWSSGFNLYMNAPAFQAISFMIDDATGNGNGNLDPGESVTITIPTLNSGHSTAPGTTGVLTSGNPHVNVSSGTFAFNDLGNGVTTDAVYSITVDPASGTGEMVSFTYQVTSGAYVGQWNFIRTIGMIYDDFETGDLTKFSYVMSGNLPWTISTEDPYEGAYCAKSGAIGNSQSSILEVTLDVQAEDSISFFRKVSSEQDYDFLAFYIDGTKKQEWSGEQGWARAAFPVSTGSHTFRWRYKKDNWYTAGSDAAWIDFVKFPPVSIVTSVTRFEETGGSLQVFPNPATDDLKISITLSRAGKISLSLHDASGRQVETFKENSLQASGTWSFTLSTAGLTQGLYFIRLVTPEGTSTQKLILSR